MQSFLALIIAIKYDFIEGLTFSLKFQYRPNSAVDNNTSVTQFTSRHLSLINTRTFSHSLLSTATEFVDRSKGKSVRPSCLTYLPFKRCLASIPIPNPILLIIKKNVHVSVIIFIAP